MAEAQPSVQPDKGRNSNAPIPPWAVSYLTEQPFGRPLPQVNMPAPHGYVGPSAHPNGHPSSNPTESFSTAHGSRHDPDASPASSRPFDFNDLRDLVENLPASPNGPALLPVLTPPPPWPLFTPMTQPIPYRINPLFRGPRPNTTDNERPIPTRQPIGDVHVPQYHSSESTVLRQRYAPGRDYGFGPIWQPGWDDVHIGPSLDHQGIGSLESLPSSSRPSLAPSTPQANFPSEDPSAQATETTSVAQAPLPNFPRQQNRDARASSTARVTPPSTVVSKGNASQSTNAQRSELGPLAAVTAPKADRSSVAQMNGVLPLSDSSGTSPTPTLTSQRVCLRCGEYCDEFERSRTCHSARLYFHPFHAQCGFVHREQACGKAHVGNRIKTTQDSTKSGIGEKGFFGAQNHRVIKIVALLFLLVGGLILLVKHSVALSHSSPASQQAASRALGNDFKRSCHDQARSSIAESSVRVDSKIANTSLDVDDHDADLTELLSDIVISFGNSLLVFTSILGLWHQYRSSPSMSPSFICSYCRKPWLDTGEGCRWQWSCCRFQTESNSLDDNGCKPIYKCLECNRSTDDRGCQSRCSACGMNWTNKDRSSAEERECNPAAKHVF